MNDAPFRLPIWSSGSSRIDVTDVNDGIWINQIEHDYSRTVKVRNEALEPLGRCLDIIMMDRAIKRDLPALTMEITLSPGEAIRNGFAMIVSGVRGWWWQTWNGKPYVPED